MLKITIELIPGGVLNGRTLHEIKIINNGKSKNRPETGNYNVIVDDERFENVLQEFPRNKGAISLLCGCLRKMGYCDGIK